ncbi:hypothetical protein ACLB2K_077628 [Fragaria x ananassa]
MCKTKKSTQAIEPSWSPHKPRTSKSFSSSRSNPNDPFSGNNSTNYDNFSKSSTASSVASLKSSLPENPMIYDTSEISSSTNNFLSHRLSSSSTSTSWRCTLRGKDAVVFQRKSTNNCIFLYTVEEGVLKSQELENAVRDADYTKAIQIAFKLRRPHKLYESFHELFRKREGEKQMEKALHDFGDEELAVLLDYVREWNTKPKFCHVAQFVLFKILNIFNPEEIIKVKGIQNILEALTPYSQRHYTRVDRHVRNTLLLEEDQEQRQTAEEFQLSGKSHLCPQFPTHMTRTCLSMTEL